jgi:hypothetical protein
MTESWIRVAYGRSREEAARQFVAWKAATESTPADEDVRVNWGRHADGGDYWEVLHRGEQGGPA